MSQLIQQLQAQTDSINRLAASNEALIQAMVEMDQAEADPDAESETYMDGTPRSRPVGQSLG